MPVSELRVEDERELFELTDIEVDLIEAFQLHGFQVRLGIAGEDQDMVGGNVENERYLLTAFGCDPHTVLFGLYMQYVEIKIKEIEHENRRI